MSLSPWQKEIMFLVVLVVCLSVSNIAQKVMNRLGLHY